MILLHLLFNKAIKQYDFFFEVLFPLEKKVLSGIYNISYQYLAWLVCEACHLECLFDEVYLTAAGYTIII